MTFELTPEQEEARVGARRFAQQRLADSAAAIDEEGAISADLLRELHATVACGRADPTALVVIIEELAAVSAAAAATGGLGLGLHATPVAEASGLRGMPRPVVVDTRGRLVCAAVACGVARAAVRTALDVLRSTAPGVHDQDKPHWVVADAATEVEAGRMLTLHAAQALDDSPRAEGLVAMATLAATRAAERAVDAAMRVAGVEALRRGSLLERLARDARALALTMGTEDDLRAIAAQAVLPG